MTLPCFNDWPHIKKTMSMTFFVLFNFAFDLIYFYSNCEYHINNAAFLTSTIVRGIGLETRTAECNWQQPLSPLPLSHTHTHTPPLLPLPPSSPPQRPLSSRPDAICATPTYKLAPVTVTHKRPWVNTLHQFH